MARPFAIPRSLPNFTRRHYLVARLFFPVIIWVLTRTIYPMRKTGVTTFRRVARPCWFATTSRRSIGSFSRPPTRVGSLHRWARRQSNPIIRTVYRTNGVFPIDGDAGPKATGSFPETNLRRPRRRRGGLHFPGRDRDTHGHDVAVLRGLEHILRNTKKDVPVIPVCLDRLWGSIFSYRDGKLYWKWPRLIPHPVSITFGEPLPKTTRAAEVRQVIQELFAESAIRDRYSLPPRTATSSGWRV